MRVNRESRGAKSVGDGRGGGFRERRGDRAGVEQNGY